MFSGNKNVGRREEKAYRIFRVGGVFCEKISAGFGAQRGSKNCGIYLKNSGKLVISTGVKRLSV